MPTSSGLAILCCEILMVELDMDPEHGPKGLIGTVVGFMDAVFGIYAVGSSAEEQLVMEHYGGISIAAAVGYIISPTIIMHWCSMWNNLRTCIVFWSCS